MGIVLRSWLLAQEGCSPGSSSLSAPRPPSLCPLRGERDSFNSHHLLLPGQERHQHQQVGLCDTYHARAVIPPSPPVILSSSEAWYLKAFNVRSSSPHLQFWPHQVRFHIWLHPAGVRIRFQFWVVWDHTAGIRVHTLPAGFRLCQAESRFWPLVWFQDPPHGGVSAAAGGPEQ